MWFLENKQSLIKLFREMHRRELSVFLLLFAFTLAGCATIYNPATGRRENTLSTPTEINIGKIAKAQMGLNSLRMGDVTDEQLERVQKVGANIATVSHRQDLPYEFGVIAAKSLNAFTLPGATIYVHTGLLEKATDEELAAVLGHEVGHVAARHAAKHLQSDLGIMLLLQIAAAAGGVEADSIRLVNSVYGLLRNGFSRKDELEADRLGLRYTRDAGYDPNGLISFFEKMLEERPEGPLDRAVVWQRTHPLASDRIEKAKVYLEELANQKFCPKCGKEYYGPSQFCAKDGYRLKKVGG
jgi:beta-barrel assembly-enhancing protease